MNNIETGVSNAVTKNGDTAMTAALPVTQTLSGADKVYLDLTATDGKRYQFIERNSDKALILKNITDSVLICEFGPTAGKVTQNGLVSMFGATGITGKFSAASSAPGSPADGDLWLDTSVVLS